MQLEVPFLDLAATTREVRDGVSEAWSVLLERSAFIGGEAVEEFEAAWSAYCGTTHAVGVANGTDAIHLTLRALGIGAGDEVVVPANTFVASAEAIVLAGARPRFADVSPDTLLLTPQTLRAALTPHTKAILVVHLYGQMADMDALRAVAAERAIPIVEDAAQAHGATWRGHRAGSLGRAGCFSFYPGKNLGAFGDAGAVVTSDADLAAHLRSLRDHGRVAGSHHQHAVVGTNSRLDALQAVVLTHKLTRLDKWNEARRGVAARYRDSFGAGPMGMLAEQDGARGVYHLGVVRVPRRDQVRDMLAAIGVGTAIHYPRACHRLGPYRRYADGPLPVVERAVTEVLSLPMFPQLTDDQVEQVGKAAQVVGEVLLAGGAGNG